MYAIISEGNLVALCDKPRYVKVNESTGAYIEAEPEEAIAVSVNGDLYNINGGSHIPGAPEAVIADRNVEEYVFRNHVRIVEDEKNTNAAIIEVEKALCELDTAAEEKTAAVEKALCELDAIISGGGDD